MKLFTTAQMRALDNHAIKQLGIPGTTLMKNAADHIAKAAMKHIPPGGYAAIFCGTGNNGGDGIGAAASLLEKGITVRTILIGEEQDLTPDANEMKKHLQTLGGTIERYSPTADIVDYVAKCAVIIDAIFGIGLNTQLEGDALSAVSIINSSHALVISADIPTGTHADTGAILGDTVKANITITFTQAKPGHYVEPGCINCGEIQVCDIGIPKELENQIVSHKYAAMASDIHIPRRRRDTHKGDYGRALIIAGSIGYTGAPALSARAATKMGAGLVNLGVPESIYNILASKLDEEMPFPLQEDKKGRLIANNASELRRRVIQSDVCLIGPGLGESDDISELVQSLTQITETPIILDADGLNAIAGNIDILNQATCPLILTPHPGEFERLGGKLTAELKPDGTPGKPVDRLSIACDFASKYGCILVLKGHRTIVALPNGIAYVNTTGGPAMAKAGSGDVLAGMIAALIAQKFPLVHAIVAAVYIHGLSGDLCAAELGEYCVTATDIITNLPKAIQQIETI